MHIVRFPDSRLMKDVGTEAFRTAGLGHILLDPQSLVEEGKRAYTVDGLVESEIKALEGTGLAVEVYEGLKPI